MCILLPTDWNVLLLICMFVCKLQYYYFYYQPTNQTTKPTEQLTLLYTYLYVFCIFSQPFSHTIYIYICYTYIDLHAYATYQLQPTNRNHDPT